MSSANDSFPEHYGALRFRGAAIGRADPEAAGLDTLDDASAGGPRERKSDIGRVLDLINNWKDQPEGSALKNGIALFFKYGLQPLLAIIMGYFWVCRKLYIVYCMLPLNILQMIFSIALCFYGGHFLASFAAIEAFRNMGGQRFLEDAKVIWQQASLVAAANEEDDKKDDDGNGVADVQELSNADLVNRKAMVFMIAIREPQKLQVALGNLWSAWMAELAVLRLEFARTIAIALGIAEMLELPFFRLFGPLVAFMVGPKLHHWVYTICSTIIKVFAWAFAWYLQTIISAFYSAIRGGKLFAQALFNIANERGWMEQLPDGLVKKPFNPDESYLDECIAYPLAALGFYTQWAYGFGLPFPQNIALFPLTIVEYIIRWQVTWG